MHARELHRVRAATRGVARTCCGGEGACGTGRVLHGGVAVVA
jgi:hypothetical protein